MMCHKFGLVYSGWGIEQLRGGDEALPKLLWDFLLSDMKDFARSQASTFTEKAIISRKQCKIEML